MTNPTNREAEGADRGLSDAIVKRLETYADSYDTMRRMNNNLDATVQCRSVAEDIRRNMVNAVRQEFAARTTAPEGREAPCIGCKGKGGVNGHACTLCSGSGIDEPFPGAPLSDGSEELRTAAQAVVDRFDRCKDVKNNIEDLRQALARTTKAAPPADGQEAT